MINYIFINLIITYKLKETLNYLYSYIHIISSLIHCELFLSVYITYNIIYLIYFLICLSLVYLEKFGNSGSFTSFMLIYLCSVVESFIIIKSR